MPADPAAPVTEPRHSCGPRADLIETAARALHRSWTLGRKRGGWGDLSATARATYRRVACDVLTEVLDEHEQQIRADDVWAEAKAERERAHAKHGETSMEAQPADALLRLSILMEEVGEVAKEFNDARHSGTLDLAAVRKELVQVCAMAGAWADAIAARGTEGGTR